MAELQRILSLLAEHNIEPKRSFGQNFLVDEAFIEKILDALDASSYDVVLEIGPGLGALTLPLSKRARKLVAVEADRDMVACLSPLIEGAKNTALINCPFERWDRKELGEGDLLIVGNLPYNLTTRLLEATSQMSAKKLGFMVQKEVAEKLSPSPGGRADNALSAYLSMMGPASLLGPVPRGSFYPVPNVDSCFVIVDIQNQVDFSIYQVLKQLYSKPNKTIRNNLKKSFWDGALEKVEGTLGPLLEKRARQLSKREREDLSKTLVDASIL